MRMRYRCRGFLPRSSLRTPGPYAVPNLWALRRDLLHQQALMVTGPRVRGNDKSSCTQVIAGVGLPGRLFSNSRQTLKLAFPGESASDAQGECFRIPRLPEPL